jgi:peptidoglycan/LPS O-acetylase OafA/YrhL
VTQGHHDIMRNFWLDTCRALAILLVLLSHGRVFLRDALPWTDVLRFGGFIGVELFFVLSGFLIGGILIRMADQPSIDSLRTFYLRRWLRTLPNYYLFLLLNLLLVWLAVRPGEPGDAWRYALFLQNLITPPPVFFQEAWSLAVEEVFYLLFPVLFLLIARIFRCPPERAILYAALAVILACLGARFAVAATVTSWEEQIRKVVFLRFDTLMFGVLLAWVHARNNQLLSVPAIAAMVVLFFGCIAYFAVHTDQELNSSMFAKTAFMSLSSMGCAGLVIAGLRQRLPGWLAASGRFFARISYAAYLTNLPVAMGLAKVFPCCNLGLYGSLAMWLAFMTLTIGISYLVYSGFEQPINRLRDRKYPG